MELTGSQIVMECLVERGVTTVFGYPGSAALDLYNELANYAPRIKHIRTTHEQHAAHAADGYARASGRTGVCFATSGPGATNLLTGLSSAYMDSIPLVAITSNVKTALIGQDAFQEVDIYGISMPVTKHSFLVKDVAALADTLRKAFYIAASGRPGPVLIDIPFDVTVARTEYAPRPPRPVLRTFSGSEEDLAQAAALLNAADRPVILAGGGVFASRAEAELAALAEKAGMPILRTLMGLCSPKESENFLGLAGIYGEEAANDALLNADLVFAVGARFSERTLRDRPLPKNTRVLHLDIDPAEINKTLRADLSLVGDARLVLKKLLPLVEGRPGRFHKPAFSCPPAAEIFRLLASLAGKDQIYTTEVGQHQLLAAKYLGITSPGMLLTSGGLGAMGFGLGAAVGAALAAGKRIVNLAGDGSFFMNLSELSTLKRYNLPVVEFVFNNGSLGLVKQLQERLYGQVSEIELERKIDYTALAGAFGIPSFQIETWEQAEDRIWAALRERGPALIDCALPFDYTV